MKKILLILALFLISNGGFAQWTTNAGNTITSTTNQIGIGTSAPATSVSLQVMGTTVLGGSNIASGAGFSTSFLANSKLLLIGWNRSSAAGETDFISNQGNGSLGGFRFYNHDNSNTETVLMNIMGSGNVQFGATAPTSASTYKLELYGSDPLLGLSGSVNGVGQTIGLEFNQQTTTAPTRQGGAIKSIATGTYTGGSGSTYNADIAFYSAASGVNTERMRILSNGNLLVGKTSQTNTTYKIDVNGSIRSNSIVVNTTGADFVFAPTYKLSSLASVDSYIKKNHHLPDIASANEMQANGVNVAETQTKLLQKTEELTLYLIEKDKQVKQQQTQIDALQKQLKAQAKSLKALQATIEKLADVKTKDQH